MSYIYVPKIIPAEVKIDQGDDKKKKNLGPFLMFMEMMLKLTESLNKTLKTADDIAVQLSKDYEAGQKDIDQINNEIKNLKEPSNGASKAEVDAYNNKLSALQFKLNMAQAAQQKRRQKVDKYWQVNIQATNTACNGSIRQGSQVLFALESCEKKINHINQ